MTWLNPVLRLCVLAAALTPAGAHAQVAWEPFRELTGFAQVLSGDEIAVNGTPVRLYGIDAPELGQTCTSRRGVRYDCGEGARNVLDAIIGANDVTCYTYAPMATDGEVGRCFVGSNDIAEVMVRRGWAYSMPSLTHRYEGTQATAQSRRAGVWSGRAQRPWIWRAEQASNRR